MSELKLAMSRVDADERAATVTERPKLDAAKLSDQLNDALLRGQIDAETHRFVDKIMQLCGHDRDGYTSVHAASFDTIRAAAMDIARIGK